MSTSLQLTLFFLTLASFLGLCVFGLWRTRSVACQLILAVLTGCFTYFIVATAISLASPSSLASSMYFRVLGLAPYLGHMFDPTTPEKKGSSFECLG